MMSNDLIHPVAESSTSRSRSRSRLSTEDSTAKVDETPSVDVEEPFLAYGGASSPPHLPLPLQRQRLRIRRAASPVLGRIRWILGPATPLADHLLPRPSPSCSISITTGKSSSSLSIDREIRQFTRRRRLHRWYFYLPFLALWTAGFILLFRQQWYPPNTPPIIGCTASPWDDWPPDVCGLDGADCESALEEGTYRCLGGCRDVVLGNPRWVGGTRVNKVPLVIGGGEDHVYRADSWVCAAAIHSNLISPSLGGCVTLTPLPYPAGSDNFPNSTFNNIKSYPFAPHFPAAYRLSGSNTNGCLDIHPFISTYNAACLFLFTLLFAKPLQVLGFVLVLLGYLQITLVSDPRYQPPSWDYIFGGLGPVAVAGYWMWKVAFKRTIKGFRELPFEMALWQGLGYWIGIESSTIFAKLPITRLGYDPLNPAGVICLTVILVCVAIVVCVQAYAMRKVGLLQFYLLRYLPLVPILIILANIPGYVLRIHHYLYSLAAIPVLSLPNRVSLFFQAFMLGLFLDGVGRWGWASILQSTGALLGDVNAGTYIPEFTNSTSNATSIGWLGLGDNETSIGITGFSLIVNDILKVYNTTNTTLPLSSFNLSTGISNFFRLAYVANGTTLDYINPVTISPNGTWSGI